MNVSEVFGTNGGRANTKGLAKRISTWWLRCVMESKQKVFNATKKYQKDLILAEFRRRWKYTMAHYSGICGALCPCQEAREFKITIKIREDNKSGNSTISTLPDELVVFILEILCEMEKKEKKEILKENGVSTFWKHLNKNKESLGYTRIINKYFQCISEDRELRVYEEKRKERKMIDVKDNNLIVKLEKIFEKMNREAPSYCHHGHTCFVESLWNQRTVYMSKRTHYWQYYELRSICTCLHRNLGHPYKKLILVRLNLQVSQKCVKYIDNKNKQTMKHAEKIKTKEAKIKKQANKQKKNKDRESRKKNYKGNGEYLMLGEKLIGIEIITNPNQK